MEVGSTHHYGVNVSDIEESVEFYEDKLGLERVIGPKELSDQHDTLLDLDVANGRFAVFDGDGVRFELKDLEEPEKDSVNDGRSPQDVGDDHFCWQVDDIDAAYEELSEEGVEFLSEPRYVPTVDCKVVYFYDPDGNMLEFVEPQ